MIKYFVTLGAAALLYIPASAHAGAVAVCIENVKNSAGQRYDLEYYSRNGSSKTVDGFVALTAAKKDHARKYPDSTPYCRHNGTLFQDEGYWMLIKSGPRTENPRVNRTHWALGFGKDRAAAIDDARRELRSRDGSWIETKHGYYITDEGSLTSDKGRKLYGIVADTSN